MFLRMLSRTSWKHDNKNTVSFINFITFSLQTANAIVFKNMHSHDSTITSSYSVNVIERDLPQMDVSKYFWYVPMATKVSIWCYSCYGRIFKPCILDVVAKLPSEKSPFRQGIDCAKKVCNDQSTNEHEWLLWHLMVRSIMADKYHISE